MDPLLPRIILIVCSMIAFPYAQASDRYKNFKELTQAEKRGVDYDIDIRDRHSKFCVIAIHGGGIEPGSEALAKEIAAQDLSYYLFIAKKPARNVNLHITSTHFDDPEALALVKIAMACISVHGFKEETQDIACIGGGNLGLRDKIASQLKASEPLIQIESPCERFGGTSRDNITNLSTQQGVQIELSTHLRKKFLGDVRLLKHFAQTVRTVIKATL